jgi:hypothetical protein
VRPNWGAVVVGAVAGLGAGLVLAVPLLAMGVADTETAVGQIVLILIVFAGQVAAGYIAARFAGRGHPLNGSLAALALFAVTASISIASGADPGAAALVINGIVAIVLGTAGGVLVQARNGPTGG